MSDQTPVTDRARALEAALRAVEAEEELDGPMPARHRAAFLRNPEDSLRATVRATKAGIYARIQSLLQAPAEGVSPQPYATCGDCSFQTVCDVEQRCAMDEASVHNAAPVSPVEPPQTGYIAPSETTQWFARFCERPCVTRTHCFQHGRCLAECTPDAMEPTGAPAPCVWRDEGLWQTGCGEEWTFPEGGPVENGMRFCFNCGHPLTVER